MVLHWTSVNILRINASSDLHINNSSQEWEHFQRIMKRKMRSLMQAVVCSMHIIRGLLLRFSLHVISFSFYSYISKLYFSSSSSVPIAWVFATSALLLYTVYGFISLTPFSGTAVTFKSRPHHLYRCLFPV